MLGGETRADVGSSGELPSHINEAVTETKKKRSYVFRVRKPEELYRAFCSKRCRTISLIVSLVVVGVALITAGVISLLLTDKLNGIAFIVIGALLFLPGAWQGYVLYQIYQRQAGYERDDFMDEEFGL
ncbi:hypothetical protein Pelo_15492 [Pelomyxa schiedti]|nr:hypothetical protein Pelo_15492 [Pelomyxa schiedti]